ncbi:hypothetical protein CAL29_24645 [Bordetella genomosp. 10]|uniref:IclR family transcriptional regulator n=1 Tax=Bordetella genomosp. 10 TaxID=1416804 RepID=A0A261S1T4_9BORD|nr:IclR family transcriptional regulator [Bordetella genomosp. 10]OZI31125.1 hypothetical protein CAL29_24645 [Bordetella genomosp. 10]
MSLPPSSSNRSGYTIESVRTAMDLLFSVCGQPDLGVTELARKNGLGKARAYRLLRTLEECGLVKRTEEQRFRLGHAALLVGSAATAQINLANLAAAELARVGEAVQESTQLRIREGDESVCIGSWEPNRDLRVHIVLGRRRRLGLGSNKALLAFESADEIESTLDRLYAASDMPVPREVLRARLDEARRNGYCISRGEVSEHLVSMSVPVYAKGRKPVAALNISAPAIRMSEERIRYGIEQLLEASARLSAKLGCEQAA